MRDHWTEFKEGTFVDDFDEAVAEEVALYDALLRKQYKSDANPMGDSRQGKGEEE